VSLISIVVFVQFWKPKYRPEYHATFITNKPSPVDEENADQSSTLSENAHSGKYQTQEISSKASISERENVGSIEQLEANSSLEHNSKETDGADNTKGGLQKLDVERLSLKQTLLAWSPWVIIVVVVIM
jgi:glycolate permease